MRSSLATLLAVTLAAHGCARLTPYDEARRSRPDHEFLRINDQWVHFESGGGGDAVMLIHGFGGSTYTWRKSLPALADRFRTIAIDLNGFGYTQRPVSPTAYSVAGQRDLVLGVMDSLGVERAHVVGHSYGAGIAARLAFDRPDRIRSLTFVGGGLPSGSSWPLPRVVTPFVVFWVKYFALREDVIRDALRGAVLNPEIVTDEVVREYLDRLRIEGIEDAIYGLTAAAGPKLPPVDPAAFQVPAQLLWGRFDRVIPIRVGEGLAVRIPNSQLIRFDHSGHLPMEEEPDEFVAALIEFFDAVP